MIAVLATGSIALLHADFLPQLLAGTPLASIGTMLETSKGALTTVILLAQLFLQTRLVFPTIGRRTLWAILIALMSVISWEHFVEYRKVSWPSGPAGWVLLLIYTGSLILVFFGARRRPWLGILIVILAPLTFWSWDAAVMPWLEDSIDALLEPTPLWLEESDVLYMGALALHNIITAAIIAWLMPPCAPAPQAEQADSLSDIS